MNGSCFFIGERRSAVIATWDAEFYGTLGWGTLFYRCLVEEDEDGQISIHNHLRDMGRDITNGQLPYCI